MRQRLWLQCEGPIPGRSSSGAYLLPDVAVPTRYTRRRLTG